MVSHYSNIMAKKLHSMLETPEKKKYLNFLFSVKKFFSYSPSEYYGQLAWVKLAHQRLNVKYPKNRKEWFEEWLVGLTDGDGCFSISYQKENKWNLTFKISQSKVNVKLLHYIKKELGCGNITEEVDKLNYRIRDKDNLTNKLIPIFEKYPLLTYKYFDYLKFKHVLEVLNDSIRYPVGEIKNLKIEEIISKDYSLIYSSKISWVNKLNNNRPCSPIWDITDKELPDKEYWKSKISKPWLIGFIEAEGSLYITKKDSSLNARYSHGFGITQKKDSLLLEGIKQLLRIPSKVKKHNNFYSLDNTNNKVNLFLNKYFKCSFKGIKSLQYAIWSRSLIKSKNILDIEEKKQYLKETQDRLKNIVKKDQSN